MFFFRILSSLYEKEATAKKTLDISHKIWFINDNFNHELCGIVKPFLWFLFMQLFLQTNLLIFVFRIIVLWKLCTFNHVKIKQWFSVLHLDGYVHEYYLCVSIIYSTRDLLSTSWNANYNVASIIKLDFPNWCKQF